MSAILVLAIRKLDGKSAVTAFVDIRIGGVTIKSARVIQQPDRPAWLAMPSVKTERAWQNVVELSDALKERVREVVLTRWDGRPAAGPSTEGHHNSTRQQRRDFRQEAIDEWAPRFDARSPDQEPPF